MVHNGGTTSSLKQYLDRLHKSNIQEEGDTQPTAKQLHVSITQFATKGKRSSARGLSVPYREK